MWVLVQWTPSIPHWTNEVVLDKQPLFTKLRNLVIMNYLESVNEPKHFVKQYFVVVVVPQLLHLLLFHNHLNIKMLVLALCHP